MARKNTQMSLWGVWFLIVFLSLLWIGTIAGVRRVLNRDEDPAPEATAPTGEGEGEKTGEGD